ncbi:hypothetical protein HYV64_00895 [Candidatus Shapirobacteria bacterium]|nr:hypothetical protein [Candidatus Shapirobacteria bacterium]
MKKKINISDKTLRLIEQRQIKPIPRWEFIVKNWSIWLGFLTSLLLLMLGVAVSWFGLIDNIITPNLWVVVSIIFLTMSFLLFERTKKSYRFEKWQVGLVIVFVGLLMGGVLFRFGVASRIDRGMESRFSFYRQMVPMRMIVWNNPESGYLSGEIVSIYSASSFVIKDFNGKLWNINGNQPIVRGRVKMVVGEEIKLIGTLVSGDTFDAEEIRPWDGMGQNMMKENRY